MAYLGRAVIFNIGGDGEAPIVSLQGLRGRGAGKRRLGNGGRMCGRRRGNVILEDVRWWRSGSRRTFGRGGIGGQGVVCGKHGCGGRTVVWRWAVMRHGCKGVSVSRKSQECGAQQGSGQGRQRMRQANAKGGQIPVPGRAVPRKSHTAPHIRQGASQLCWPSRVPNLW